MAYYPSWSIYHTKYPLYARDLPVSLLDTIIYAFIQVDDFGNLLEPPMGAESNNFHDFLALKKIAIQEGRKLLLLYSVGGWGEGSLPFAKFTHSLESRRNFVQQALDFCKKYGLDGIDIDWEFPKEKKEGRFLALLLMELSKAFKKEDKNLLVTAAFPGHPSHYEEIPWNYVVSSVDRAHIMSYSLHGPWKDLENQVTNHQNALEPTLVGSSLLNIKSIMKAYEEHFPTPKLFVGIPLFFTTYANATGGNLPSHYASPYSGPGVNPNRPEAAGELLYKEVMEDMKQGKALGFWDKKAHAFSVYYPESKMFGSGVDDQALKEIIYYITSSNYGGGMFWSLQGDTHDWHALRLFR